MVADISGGAGRLVAVIVTCNRLAQLQAAIARLCAAPEAELSAIVVVDNGSDDGTWAWLNAQSDPRLHLLELGENRGGAGGFETGMRHAMDRLSPDWLMIMDDDARPKPGALTHFHSAPRDQVAAWAAAVTYPSGEICEMNRPSQNPFWHTRRFFGALVQGRRGFHISDAEFTGPEICDIDVTSFVGFFISAPTVRQIGYPDPELFIYGEDVLYTLALRRAGGRMKFDPNLGFEHDCKASEPGSQVFSPVWRAYYHHRNKIMIYRQVAGPLFWPILSLFLPKWLLLQHRYGPEAPIFRTLLKRAIRDGIKGDTSRSFDEVRAICDAAKRPE
ncbi:MAG: glycosyltransferase [Maritimibacter sp.]